MQLLSGATLPPSMLDAGVAQWIASLAVSRAKTCHSQADALGLTVNAAACSLKFAALPTIAVRGSSFWRTSQASLLPPPPLWTKPKALSTNAQPPASWENWPTSGGMRNGQLFQRPTLEPATGVRGGFAGHGAWTTPVATEHQKDRMTDEAMARELVRPSAGMALCKDVRFWTTPDVCSGARDMSKIDPEAQKRANTKRTTGLPTEAQNWATPDCNTSTYSNGKMGPNIREQAANWPTPSAAVMNDGETPETWHARAATLKEKHGNGNGAGLPLTVAAVQWPTPMASDDGHKVTINSNQAGLIGASHQFMERQFSPQAQPTPPGQASSSTGPTSPRRLNPAFTEWLMGWPTGWTIAAPSASSAAATALWRHRLHLHLSALCAE